MPQLSGKSLFVPSSHVAAAALRRYRHGGQAPAPPRAGRQGALPPPPFPPPPAAMAAFPRHRRFLGGFVCGAAAGTAVSCWAAWRLLRSQSQPETVPGRALPEGKSRGQSVEARARRPRGSAGRERRRLSSATVPTDRPPPPAPKPAPSPLSSLLRPGVPRVGREGGEFPEYLRRAWGGGGGGCVRRLFGDAGL